MNVGLLNNINLSQVGQAPKVNLSEKDFEKAKQASEDFEAFFISKMMESMFEGVSTDGMFGGGHAEKIYRSLLLDEYGKVMAKTGNVGVSDSIMDSIIKMQEASQAAGGYKAV